MEKKMTRDDAEQIYMERQVGQEVQKSLILMALLILNKPLEEEDVNI